jgi:hypothetical protein
MTDFLDWLEDAYWHWRHVFYFRFADYNDTIDRYAFFEELNIGWHEMYHPDLEYNDSFLEDIF